MNKTFFIACFKDSQVDASQRKFAKPEELAYGLAKGGPNGLTSQLASSLKSKSRKFNAYTIDL